MRRSQATQIVSLLQKVPLHYRNFGIYWWHIKAELKRLGFTKAVLPILGDYDDPAAKQYYAGKKTDLLEEEAFVFQIEHARHKYCSNHSFIPADNEVYIIQDHDLE